MFERLRSSQVRKCRRKSEQPDTEKVRHPAVPFPQM